MSPERLERVAEREGPKARFSVFTVLEAVMAWGFFTGRLSRGGEKKTKHSDRNEWLSPRIFDELIEKRRRESLKKASSDSVLLRESSLRTCFERAQERASASKWSEEVSALMC